MAEIPRRRPPGSSTVHARLRAFAGVGNRRPSAGSPRPRPETAPQRGGQVGHRQADGKENPMPAQQQLYATDRFGVLPSALVVLMTILAMLGVIAHAAIA